VNRRHKNVGWTAFNEPGLKFTPAKKYNIKGALLFADYTGGLGYVSSPDLMDVYMEAAYRVESNTMRRPTTEILANIEKWLAVFFGQGLWDTHQSPEGTYEAYRRAKGLKELVFFRGGTIFTITEQRVKPICLIKRPSLRYRRS
jgi:hypothetical protein